MKKTESIQFRISDVTIVTIKYQESSIALKQALLSVQKKLIVLLEKLHVFFSPIILVTRIG